ncbi:hypothetical protein O988_02355 [Pseudogymnoascus sp. VKM F-3808]|nr:hypothetical protein O988_02355 [Pseudogymnoascus sp. VKM F-3808]
MVCAEGQIAKVESRKAIIDLEIGCLSAATMTLCLGPVLAARSYSLPRRPTGNLAGEGSWWDELWTDVRYRTGVSNLHTTTGGSTERCDWSAFEGISTLL